MMNDEAEFLGAIVAAADDDGPRLAFAEWLEKRNDPRGAFIRVQCELARLSKGCEQFLLLRERSEELLRQHAEEWLRPQREYGGKKSRWEFRRGFVTAGTVDGLARFGLEELFLHAPLLAELRFEEPDPSEGDSLLDDLGGRAPQVKGLNLLTRLKGLDLSGVRHGAAPVGAKVCQLLLAPHLSHLETLNLANLNLSVGIDFSGFDAVVLASTEACKVGDRIQVSRPVFDRLVRLNLSHTNITHSGISQLLSQAGWPRLCSLDLSYCNLLGTVVWDLAQLAHRVPQLQELNLSHNDDFGAAWGNREIHIVAAFVMSPLWDQLTVLDLSFNALDNDGAYKLIQYDVYVNGRYFEANVAWAAKLLRILDLRGNDIDEDIRFSLREHYRDRVLL